MADPGAFESSNDEAQEAQHSPRTPPPTYGPWPERRAAGSADVEQQMEAAPDLEQRMEAMARRLDSLESQVRLLHRLVFSIASGVRELRGDQLEPEAAEAAAAM